MEKFLDKNQLQRVLEDVKGHLDKKQETLTGQTGQVVGFGDDGKAVPQDLPVPPAAQVSYDGAASGVEAATVQGALDALSVSVSRVSNENLLDNADFRDPINQRGKTEYTVDWYTIDRYRWYGNIGKLQIVDGVLRISNEGKTQVFFGTVFEASRLVAGKTYTASIIGSLEHQLVAIWVDGIGDIAIGTSTVTFTMPAVADDTECRITTTVDDITAIYDLYAFKLEQGSVQTGISFVNGNWVLNDPPPNKALELAKCQRYFCKSDVGHIITKSDCISYGDIHLVPVSIHFPVPMRTTPVVKLYSNTISNGGVEGFLSNIMGGVFSNITIRTRDNSIYSDGFGIVDVIGPLPDQLNGYFTYTADANL